MLFPAATLNVTIHAHAPNIHVYTRMCGCSKLGPWIAKRRAPKVAAKYAEIGGGSPILDWTRKQGQLLVQHLDQRRKESAPHKVYVGFRYAQPLLEQALDEIMR